MRERDGRVVNANELRVIGMSRSGNHAVIQWILGQARGRVCLLNCAAGKSNPFLTARPMGDGDSAGAYANYAGFDLDTERRGVFSRKEWLIYSHEDEFLGNACGDEFDRRHDEYVGATARRRDLLLLRDPFNLFASRRRAGYGTVSDRVALAIWKQHARQFLGRTHRLRHDPLAVSYNRWVSDQTYRRRLAEALGLAFTDAGIDTVAPCAGGSSFDGLAYDGRASEMKVFRRWEAERDNPSFLALFDDEVLALSEQVFGPPPLPWAPPAPASRPRRSGSGAAVPAGT